MPRRENVGMGESEAREQGIIIKYDGAYPNLCSGQLVVTIGGKRWQFPSYCLVSGGNVSFDANWSEHVSQEPWTISKWPEEFPEQQKAAVTRAINEEIPWGCCGGCV